MANTEDLILQFYQERMNCSEEQALMMLSILKKFRVTELVELVIATKTINKTTTTN